MNEYKPIALKIKSMIFKISCALFIIGLSACKNPLVSDSGHIDADFLPGLNISMSNSVVSVSAPTVAAGSEVEVKLELKDKNQKLIDHDGLKVEFAFTSSSSQGEFSAFTHVSTGIYTTKFKGLVSGSVGAMVVTVNAARVASTLPPLQVIPGAFSPVTSTLSASQSTIASESQVHLNLVTRDALGNHLDKGGLNVALAYAGGQSTGAFSSVTDNGDGTYDATFTAKISGTATQISANVSDQALQSEMPSITVVPGESSAAQSVVATSLNTIQAGASTSLSVIVKDANGNRQTAGGRSVVFSLGAGTSTGTISNVVDHNDGSYTADLSGVTAGSATTINASIDGSDVVSTLPQVTVTHAAASQIVLSTPPSTSTVAGVAIATQPIVSIKDAFNNVVTTGADASAAITFALQTGTGTLSGTVSLNATSGVANFNGQALSVNLVGANKVLRASAALAAGTRTVDSVALTITHAAASQIVMSTQPSASTVAAVAFAAQPIIEIRDAFGNVVTTGIDATRTIALALQTGTGTLSGTASMAAVAGVADFSGKGLNINLTGVNKVLRASTTITAAAVTIDSSAFTIIQGPASQLVMSTQPSVTSLAGVVLATQPVIEIRDAQGNVITTGVDATRTISLALQTGTGTLSGTVSMAAVAGVADFSGKGLNIDLIGTDKVLRASTTISSGTVSIDSSAFTITHAAASQIVMATQPSASTAAGSAFATQPIIEVRDALGNVVSTGIDATRSITIALQTGTGVLSGTASMAAVNGVADFSGKGLNINLVGANKILRASATITAGAQTVDSSAFTITQGAASQLVMTTQPSVSTIAGVAIATQPVIEIRDAQGNLITSGADATRTVTLALQTGTGVLSGTVSMAAVAGVADFSGKGLNINLVGVNKVLRASTTITSGAVTADSNAFTITHAAASQLVMSTQPSASTAAATAFATQPVVEIRDALGNPITTGADATRTLTLTLQTGSGTLGGTVAMAAVAGIANFTGKGLSINLVGADKVLRASTTITSGAVTVDSGAFTIVPGAASQLVMTTQPSASTVSALAFVTQPVVTIEDAQGNVITSGADAIRTITLNLQNGSGTLGGTLSMPAVAGVADFTGKGLNINLVGSNKVLRASTSITSGAVNVDSGAFTITHAAASQLVMTTQPSTSTTAATVFATQPVITIADAQGNAITTGADATRTITLSLQTGTGTLGGTLSMPAVAGVADFIGKGLNINLIGANKVLRASSTLTAGARTVDSSAFTITPAPLSLSHSTITASAAGVASGDYVNLTITAKDQYDNQFTSGGLGGAFTFSGGTSTGVISAVTDNNNGTYTATLRGAVAGTASTIHATLGGNAITNTEPTVVVGIGIATHMVYLSTPTSGIINAVLNPQPKIQLLDYGENIVTSGPDGTSNITLSLQSGTGNIQGTLSMGASNGVADFSGKGVYFDDYGSKVIRATKANLSGVGGSGALYVDSASISVADEPRKLALAGDASMNRYTCSNAYTVSSVDSSNRAAAVLSNTTITLAGNGNGNYYSDSSCLNLVSQITMARNTSSASFYFKGNAVESRIFTANSTGFTGGTLPVSILSGSFPSQVAIVGSASIQAGTCTAYAINVLNSSNASANMVSDSLINFSGAQNGQFYSDVTCATSATAIAISTGQNTKTIYYRNTNAETSTLRAAIVGLSDGTLAVTSAQGSQLKLVVSGPTTLTGATCSGAFTIVPKNSSDVTTALSGAVTVNLTGGGQGIFYSDAACTTPVTSLSMASAATSKSFYFIDDYVETATITVSDNANNLLASSADVTVSPYSLSDIQVASSYACGRMGGRIYCWGYNNYGQLGNGTYSDSKYPTRVTGIFTATAYSVGDQHACAVLADHTVKCWGYNSYGQLGNNTSTNSATPVTVSGLSTASTVAANFQNTCVVTTTNGVKCWGDNYFGQASLENPYYYNWQYSRYQTPQDITGISTATAVSVGYQFVCALLSTNTVKCWGNGEQYNLGDGNYYQYTRNLISVSGITTATAISSGYKHSCARLSDSTLTCWGYNGYGQLGDASTSTRGTPVAVKGPSPTYTPVNNATTISTQNNTTCARLSTGSLKCWGYGSYGNLGDGSTTYSASTTVSVSGITTATSVSAGGTLTCALLSDATAKCWGSNSYGQLGNGSTTASYTPTAINFNANTLGFGIPATSLVAGSCLSIPIYRFAVGNAANFPKTTSISLSESTGHHAFYSDANCSSTLTSISANAGDSQAQVYFKGADYQETVNLTASSTGYGSAAVAISLTRSPISNNAVTRIAFNSTTIPVGTCTAFSMNLYDATNRPAAASGADYTVDLSGQNGGAFYRDSDCTQVVTSVTVPVGTATAPFYYQNSSMVALTFTATDVAHSLTVNYAPSMIQATLAASTSSISTGICHPITVSSANRNSSTTSSTTALSIALTKSGSSAFYSDNSCTSVTSSATINAGNSQTTVYFKNAVAEVSTLTATLGPIANTLDITTNTINTNHLVISGNASTPAGTCTLYTVTSQEGNVASNTTATFSGAGTGEFYSDASCSSQQSTTVISSGTSSADIYYKNSYAQSVILRATATSYISATYPVTVQASALPSQLSYSGPSTLDAGACSSAFSLSSLNASNQVANLTEDAFITLSNTGLGNFYTDVGCTVQTSWVTMTSGTSVKVVYFKDAVPETITLRASTDNLSAATASLTVNPGAQLQLVLSGSATLNQTSCGAYTITSKNASNVATNVSATVTIDLNGAASGSYYSDNTCATPITQTTITSGNNNKTIYYANAYRQTLTLSVANNAGILSGSSLAVAASGPVSFTQISTGHYQTSCTLLSDGHVMCWGYNNYGQIGDGSSSSAYSPKLVSGISTATKVAVGYSHACALLANSTIKCWGYNGHGQLGNGNTTQSTTPVSVSGISNAIDIAAGTYNNCAVLSDNTVKCWGQNNYYNLGDGTNTNRSSPVAVIGLNHVTQVAMGDQYGACARIDNGTVKCWGYNTSGQVGNGSTAQYVTSPTTVVGLSNVNKVKASGNFACALQIGGAVKCWGNNGSGQFGNGNSTNSTMATSSGFSNIATDMSLGNSVACALTAGSGLKCAGANNYQMLNSSNGGNMNTPTSISGISNATALAVNNYNICVSTSDNKIKCWGYDYYGGAGDGGRSINALGVPQEVSFAADRLEFSSFNPNGVSPSSCQAVSISQKRLNQGVEFTQDFNISLSSDSATGKFYSDANCTNQVSTISASKEAFSVDLYFSESRAAISTLLTASSSAFAITNAHISLSTTNGLYGIKQYIDYDTSPKSPYVDMMPNTCTQVTVVPIDSSNQPITMTMTINVNLSVSGSLNLYSDSDCQNSGLSSVILPEGSTSATYYVMASNWAGTPYIYPYGDAGVSFSSDYLYFYVHDFYISFNSWFDTGTCQWGSIYSNNSLQQAQSVTLSTPGSGHFYSDQYCSTPITSVQFPSGNSSSNSFYFMDDVSENSEIDASVGDYIVPYYSYYTNQAATFSHLSLSGSTYNNAGDCSYYDVYMYDQWNSPLWATQDTTVNLSGAGLGGFYSDGSCSNQITSTVIYNGWYSASFYYRGNLPQNVLLTAKASGLLKSSLPVTIAASSAPVKLGLSGSQNITTDTCASYVVTSLDQSDTPSNAVSDLNITLSGQDYGSFYSEGTCSNAITSTIIYSGTNLQTVYYQNHTAQTTTLSATSLGFTEASMSVTALGGNQSLALSGPTSLRAAVCSSVYTVTLRDSSNAVVNASSNITVDLSADFGTFYSDSTCTSAITQSTINSGTSTAEFYYSNPYSIKIDLNVIDNANVLSPTKITANTTFGALKIVSTDNFTCGLFGDGTVKCWGYNGYGQLGDGTTNSVYTPVTVSGISTAVDIGAGGYSACAVLADGTVKCWGANWYGNLGDNTTTTRYTPVTVSGITNALTVSLSYYSSCAVLADSSVKCWGYNAQGQLGDGSTTSRYTPVSVSGLNGVSSVSLSYYHSCALMMNHTVKCWGANWWGNLGDGTSSDSYTPVSVSGISNATQITGGDYFNCARLSNSKVKCWGVNWWGNYGDGTSSNGNTPVLITNLTNVKSVAAGYGHTCALSNAGDVKCMGENSYGQLGDGTVTARNTPVSVSGLSNIDSLFSHGYNSSCALTSDGVLKCWGQNNYGQLGDGSSVEQHSPTFVGNSPYSLSIAESFGTINSGSCQQLTISQLTLGANANFDHDKDIVLSAQTSNNSASFYVDSECSLAMGPSLRALKGTPTVTAYFKDGSFGSSGSITAGAEGVASYSTYYSTSNYPDYLMLNYGDQYLQQGVCVAMELATYTSSNWTPAVNTSNLSVYLYDAYSYGYFYSDSGCNNQNSYFTVMSGESSTTVYYKLDTSTNSGQSYLTGYVNSGPWMNSPYFYYYPNQSLPPDTLVFTGATTNPQQGVCTAYDINTYYSGTNSAAVTNSDVYVYMYDPNGYGNFYSDWECNNQSSYFYIYSSTSATTVYYRLENSINSGQYYFQSDYQWGGAGWMSSATYYYYPNQ